MFVAALRKLAGHCEFKDDSLNDAIRNEATQGNLLTESN